MLFYKNLQKVNTFTCHVNYSASFKVNIYAVKAAVFLFHVLSQDVIEEQKFSFVLLLHDYVDKAYPALLF